MKQTNVTELLKRKSGPNVFSVEKDMRPKESLNIKSMMERRGQAKADLEQWRGLLETAYKYAVPNYNPWTNMGKGGALLPGQTLNADIFDLTLPIAHQKLCNKMLTGMVPQGQQWCKFVPGEAFGDPKGRDYRKAAEATQKFTDYFF
jgi:hypothetical protein